MNVGQTRRILAAFNDEKEVEIYEPEGILRDIIAVELVGPSKNDERIHLVFVGALGHRRMTWLSALFTFF